MKLGNGKELRATPLPAGGCVGPRVQLQLLMFGVPLATEEATAEAVRLVAAELLQAANQAEGIA